MLTMVWQILATGLLQTYINSILAIANRDARRLLIQDRAFQAQFMLDCYGVLAYVPMASAIEYIDSLVENKEVKPMIRKLPVPIPNDASVSGSAIICEILEGFDAYVYAWDYVEFTLVGLVSEMTDLENGVYVAVYHNSQTGQVGLPSQFLTVNVLK